jgi:RsiW-degrading membrane proteinase PrsW (M82 family)
MAEFLKLLPFILGAAVSPILLVTVLYVLSRPTDPIKKSLIYLLGGTITISIISIMVFYTTSIRPNPTPHKDLVPHVIIGILLLFLAYDIYKRGPAKAEQKETNKKGLFRYFGLGVILMLTNFTTIAMIFEIALGLRAANITGLTKNLYLVATILFSILPILIPLLILVLFGKKSTEILEKLSAFMRKDAYIVTSIFFAVLGAYSLLKPFI